MHGHTNLKTHWVSGRGTAMRRVTTAAFVALCLAATSSISSPFAFAAPLSSGTQAAYDTAAPPVAGNAVHYAQPVRPARAAGTTAAKLPIEVFRLNIAQTMSADSGLDAALDQLVGVHAHNGTIMFIVDATNETAIKGLSRQYSFDLSKTDAAAPDSTTFVVPGFFDLHVHAPQFANIGLGYDTELLPWLNDYTFPLEQSFENRDDGYNGKGASPESYVQRSYERVVKKMITQGTTTASYYATIHPHASYILAREVARQGQRAYVGKVNTDINPEHPELQESPEKSLADTREFIALVQSLNTTRVTPVITPRYGLGVSWDLMVMLGDLAREHGLPVQTHIDENPLEIEKVAQRFPNTTSYTDLYAQTGLFNVSHVTLGHCVHVTDDEITQMLQYPGVGCAPCPLSNFALTSGIAPIHHMLNRGLPVGLGTDAAGGYSSSALDSMRAAIIGSKALYFQNNRSAEWAHLDFDSALYLATKGSADVMGLGDKVGVLKPGYQWDALYVDIMAQGSPTSMDYNKDAGKYGPAYSLREMVSKFIYEGDDRNIVKVWVDGKKVKDIGF